MLSERPWNRDDIIRLVLGMVATICFGLLLGGVLFQFARDLPPHERDLFGMVVSMFVVQGGIILWIAFFLREQKITWSRAFGFRTAGLPRVLLLGSLCGLFVLPATMKFFVRAERKRS